jgi:hypothetical protein
MHTLKTLYLYLCFSHLQEDYSGSDMNTLMRDFRAKFFRYGEQQRKQRKLRKTLAREAYMQAISQREEEKVTFSVLQNGARNEDREGSSSER